MATYIEREAVEKFIENGLNNPNEAKRFGHDAIEIMAEVHYMPAADVAPVVRCKECEHAERYERINETAGYYCGHPRNTFTYGERWDRVFKPVKEADDFCSYGE